jgi:diacylglycerol kinase (ATP)
MVTRSRRDFSGALRRLPCGAVSVALLYNPISGSGRAHATAARMREGLERAGHRVAMIPTERGAPSEWLRPALERGARGSIELGSIEAGSIEAGPIEAVVVAGGDGAVRLAAGECARAAIPLWHAPCGTENLFARSFGMRSDPAAVASALVARRTRAIDLGHADGQPFVLMASFGFDADVVHALARTRTGAITHLSYAAPILRTIGSWRARDLGWSIDGEHEPLGEGMIVVGNLPDYGVRLNPAAEAVPDDGLLDAVFLPASTPLAIATWVPWLRTGMHLRHPAIRQRRGRRIEIHADRPVLMQIDGDAAGPGDGSRRIELGISGARLPVLLPAG